MSLEARPLQRKAERQGGFTLIELMIGMTLTVALMVASASLLRDYMATAKTIQVAADANADMMNLLRDVRRVFQTSIAANVGNQRRACILQFNGAGDRANLANYRCNIQAGVVAGVRTDGIGFGLDPAGLPQQAFVNACEAIPAGAQLTAARGGGFIEPPRHPTDIATWGNTAAICPAACPAGTRPVVKFLTAARGEIVQRQLPRQSVQPDGVVRRASLPKKAIKFSGGSVPFLPPKGLKDP